MQGIVRRIPGFAWVGAAFAGVSGGLEEHDVDGSMMLDVLTFPCST